MNEKLGKYEIIKLLGEGATAHVYHARDTQLHRDVALKILRTALVSDGSAFDRFIQEAQAAAGLFHPNLATVLEMGEADGRFFISMRYVEGKSLARVLKEDGPLSWVDAKRMASQVGSALDFAHKKGFLHRDVKPSNIIVSEDGEFILTDFGLTRAMMNTGITSHTGAILGTPAYIAPEVWQGEDVGPAADQYALGCVLVECLTGKTLFDGDTPPRIMTQHVLSGPEFPKKWPKDVPPKVARHISRMLSKEPVKRFTAFNQLDVALAQTEKAKSRKSDPRPVPVQTQTEPDPSIASSKAPGTSKVSKKRINISPRWWLTGIAGFVVLCIIGSFVYLWQSGRIGPKRITTEIADEITVLQTLPAGGIVDLAVSPDNQQIAVLSSSRVDLLNSETLEKYQDFEFDYASFSQLEWSPDGKYLALIDQEERVVVIASATGISVREISVRADNSKDVENPAEPSLAVLKSVSWSPNAKQLATVDSDGFLKIWEAVTGSLVSSYGGLDSTVNNVVWSPDGKQVAVSSSYGKVELLNLAQGSMELVDDVSAWGVVRHLAWSPDSRLLAVATFGQVWVKHIDSGQNLYENALWVTDIAWSPEGDLLAISGETITLLETDTWVVAGSLVGSSDRVNAIAFTPDGEQLLAGSADGALRLWSIEPGLNYFSINTDENVRLASWNPDHHWLALSVGEQSIQIWDIANAMLAAELDFQVDVEYLSWSQGGRQLAVVTNFQETGGKEIVIWDKGQNDIVGQVILEQNKTITAVQWSPEDDWLAVTQDGYFLSMLNTTNLDHSIVFENSEYGTLSWSPDQERMASADGNIYLWDTATGTLENTLDLKWDSGIIQYANEYEKWHSSEDLVTSSPWKLSWSSDGDYIAGLVNPQHVVVWNTPTGKITAILDAGEDVTDITWSPNTDQLFMKASRQVIVWDRESQRYLGSFNAASSPYGEIFSEKIYAMYRTGNRIGDVVQDELTYYEGELPNLAESLGATLTPTFYPTVSPQPMDMTSVIITVYQIHPPEITRHVASGHTGSITSMDLSDDGRYLVSGARDDTVVLWDLEQGQVVETFSGHMWGVRSVDLHPDGEKLVSGDGLGAVRVWEIASHELLYEIEAHFGAINRVAWSPDGLQLATAGMDGTIRLWFGDTGELVKTFSWHGGTILDLAWSPDGSLLASAGSDGEIRVLHSSNGNQIANWQIQHPSTIAWSLDGKFIAVGSADEYIYLRDIQAHRDYDQMNSAEVYALAWSSDGRLLAAGEDARFAVYRTDDHHDPVQFYTSWPNNSAYSVIWHKDNAAILSGMSDGSIQIFGLEGVEISSAAAGGNEIRFISTATPESVDIPSDETTSTPTPSPDETSTPNSATVLSLLITSTPTLNPAYIPPPCEVEGETWTSPADGMTLACIPAGEFRMGSNENDDESPVHTVYLDAFWMNQTEVTNAMYAQCVDAGKCNLPSDTGRFYDSGYQDHPVVYMSWHDAQAYCKWRGARLPTEAEWEKAARGGLEGKTYPWGDETPVCTSGAINGAQYRSCDGQTVAVGSFAANGYGLYDMSGNVWEWVADWYDSGYYGSSPSSNPAGPEEGSSRVLRGGSWFDYDRDLRLAYRSGMYFPNVSDNDNGFRCARSASP